MKLKHIPNILSTFRLILVFVFVAIYFCLESEYALKIALGVFVLAGITDVIDGYLARKYNWISDLGKILDPLADKMMQCAALICLLISGRIPVWFAIPFILKELLMLAGSFFVMKEKKIVVVSNIAGKVAALFFYVVIGLVMLLGNDMDNVLLNVLCGVSLGLTIMALVVYFSQYFIKGEKEESAK